jgi:hypothetical protein
MSLIWNRRLSREIRELGYDIVTGTLIVAFPDGVRRYYGPVTYEMYTALSQASHPGRLFLQIVEGKIPRLS